MRLTKAILFSILLLLLVLPGVAEAKKIPITLVAVGDVGFNMSGKKVRAGGMKM